MLLILHSLRTGHSNFLVRTPDSHIVIIRTYHSPLFEAIYVSKCEVSVSYGTRKHERILTIIDIIETLDRKLCSSPPLFAAVISCDSTFGLRGCSKRLCFRVMNKSHNYVIEAVGSCQLLKN